MTASRARRTWAWILPLLAVAAFGVAQVATSEAQGPRERPRPPEAEQITPPSFEFPEIPAFPDITVTVPEPPTMPPPTTEPPPPTMPPTTEPPPPTMPPTSDPPPPTMPPVTLTDPMEDLVEQTISDLEEFGDRFGEIIDELNAILQEFSSP